MGTVLELLDAGSHLVAVDDMYGGSWRLFERVRRRTAGLRVSYVDPNHPDRLEQAICARHPDDLGRDAQQSAAQDHRPRPGRQTGARHAGSSPCATTPSRRPICSGRSSWASTSCVHSVTKYINGHSDAVGGVVLIGNNARLNEQFEFMQNAIGSIMDPFTSFLALRGVKTLPLRMQQHCANALKIAHWLDAPSQDRAGDLPGPAQAPAARAGGPADARASAA